MTLAARAKMFHRRFPDKRITPNALRLLYRKNNIRLRKVYAAKQQPARHAVRYALEADSCRHSLRQAISTGAPIVYLDETVFTSRTYQPRDYGRQGERVEVEYTSTNMSYICAIACVSA